MPQTPMDLWGLVTIMVAMIAFTATVRHRILDVIKAGGSRANPWHRMYLLWLSVTEAFLALAVLLITMHELTHLLFGIPGSRTLRDAGLILFSSALLVLFALLVVEWTRSLRAWRGTRKTEQPDRTDLGDVLAQMVRLAEEAGELRSRWDRLRRQQPGGSDGG